MAGKDIVRKIDGKGGREGGKRQNLLLSSRAMTKAVGFGTGQDETWVSAPLLRDMLAGMQITQVSSRAVTKPACFGRGSDETGVSAAPMPTARYFSKFSKTRARFRITIKKNII